MVTHATMESEDESWPNVKIAVRAQPRSLVMTLELPSSHDAWRKICGRAENRAACRSTIWRTHRE